MKINIKIFYITCIFRYFITKFKIQFFITNMFLNICIKIFYNNQNIRFTHTFFNSNYFTTYSLCLKSFSEEVTLKIWVYAFRTSKCGPEITLKIWIEVFPTSKCGSSHLLVQNTSSQIFNITSYEKLFIHYNINHKNLN